MHVPLCVVSACLVQSVDITSFGKAAILVFVCVMSIAVPNSEQVAAAVLYSWDRRSYACQNFVLLCLLGMVLYICCSSLSVYCCLCVSKLQFVMRVFASIMQSKCLIVCKHLVLYYTSVVNHYYYIYVVNHYLFLLVCALYVTMPCRVELFNYPSILCNCAA